MPGRNTRRRRLGRRRVGILLPAIAACVASCALLSSIPDQDQFSSLNDLRDSGKAVARLYAAPIPDLEAIAIHPWFVVKEADSTSYNRWEVWQTAGGAYGHVRKNRASPTSSVGAGGTYVIAELIGAEAESVVAFIESQSPDYPCKDNYVLFPGPNSNSYAQWVIDNTGWDVALPPSAIGKDVPANCP